MPVGGERHQSHAVTNVLVDLVIWDSHPLALGATPKQVFIDGVTQLTDPCVVHKPAAFQETPKVPNFDREAADAVKYEGLPPLAPKKAQADTIIFTNVKTMFHRASGTVQEVSVSNGNELGAVVVRNGTIVCTATYSSCVSPALATSAQIVDTQGGSVAPGLTTFGSPLGLEEIQSEASTADGRVFDPLLTGTPAILGEGALIRAVDGLQFGGRSTLCGAHTKKFTTPPLTVVSVGWPTGPALRSGSQRRAVVVSIPASAPRSPPGQSTNWTTVLSSRR